MFTIRHAPDLDGNHYEILTPAANAIAGMYQLAATLVLRSMIDFALTNSRSSRYKHAARHLMECSSLASAIDDFGAYEAHDAYEARLGREHGRNIRGDAVGEFLQIERAGVGDVVGARGRPIASNVADGLSCRAAGTDPRAIRSGVQDRSPDCAGARNWRLTCRLSAGISPSHLKAVAGRRL